MNQLINMRAKHQHDKIDTTLNKYSEDHSSIDKTIDQIETLRNTKKFPLGESIAERAKLRRQNAERLKRQKVETLKRKKRDRTQNLNSKQTINQTLSIISSNKRWK